MARNKTLDKMMAAVRKQDEIISGASAEELAAAGEAMDDLNADAGTSPADNAPVEPETPPEAPPAAEPAPAAAPPPASAPEPPAEPETPPAAAAGPTAADKAVEAQRKEIARLRAQLAAANQSRAATAPPVTPAPVAAAPAPKQEDDPEPERPGPPPNREEFPIQYDAWRDKAFEHQAWQLRQLGKNVSDLTTTVQRGAQMTERQQNDAAFDQGVAIQRRAFSAKVPDFEAAVAHLQNIDREDMRDRGIPEYEIENQIRLGERTVMGTLMLQAKQQYDQGLLPPETNIAEYAFEQIMRRAQRCGFNPAAADARPAGGPAPATPRQQVANAAARASAARSASAMKPSPARLPADDKMTAERFMNELSPLQRQNYKKQHPNWEIELGFLNESDNFIIASR